MKVKCEIYRDSMQNYKKYGIPKAQLVIADVPYNIGNNMYGSNPMWYVGGDNKNGESKLAGKAAFNSDYNFNLYEYFHFCSKMLKKEPKEKGKAPCMIVFCSFQQIPTMLKAAEKHGFGNNIHITFCKNYSAQVLKANMRVVGATEHALILYRDKLPKFNNDGKMVFDWMKWEKDPDGRPSYGFEIDRNFYERAKNEMLVENYGEVSMRAEDSVTGQRNIFDMLEGQA